MSEQSNYGFKLFNEDESLFSWHESREDAEHRQSYEKRTFGREFRISQMDEREYRAWGSKIWEAA